MNKIENMNKKELKDYVNKNGFFFHMQCNKITNEEVQNYIDTNALLNTGEKIPE
jgi:hypothetical protein